MLNLIFLLLIGATSTAQQHELTGLNYYKYQKLSDDYVEAFKFIERFQSPSNCTNHKYSITEFYGGGFASQFQVAGGKWLSVAAGHSYEIPTLIRGPIRQYSEGHECHHKGKDWTCFLLPMSSCQEELLATGIRIDPSPKTAADIHDSMVPPQFAHRGLAWWWGAVQAYMFRLQPPILEYVLNEMQHIGFSFPLEVPVAGLHVRHGDKFVDGFKHQSFEAELLAVHQSPDCRKVENNTCFTMNQIKDIGYKYYEDFSYGVNASTSLHLENKDAQVLHPLAVFVASDDPKVLEAAKELGYLTDSSGVSQQTTTEGTTNTTPHRIMLYVQ